MGLIPKYAHYYMDEDQITDLHKKEIWQAYESVNRQFKLLLDFQKDWFKKYFPEQLNESSKDATR